MPHPDSKLYTDLSVEFSVEETRKLRLAYPKPQGIDTISIELTTDEELMIRDEAAAVIFPRWSQEEGHVCKVTRAIQNHEGSIQFQPLFEVQLGKSSNNSVEYKEHLLNEVESTLQKAPITIISF